MLEMQIPCLRSIVVKNLEFVDQRGLLELY